MQLGARHSLHGELPRRGGAEGRLGRGVVRVLPDLVGHEDGGLGGAELLQEYYLLVALRLLIFDLRAYRYLAHFIDDADVIGQSSEGVHADTRTSWTMRN